MVKATGSCLAPDPATMVLMSSVVVFVAGLLRSWSNFQKMVALTLVGLFDTFAKRAHSNAGPGAGNGSGRAALGAAMLVAWFQRVAEGIFN